MAKTLIIIATVALLAEVAAAQQPAFKRTILQQADISIESREAVTARADLPPGVSAGRHTHPGEEVGYVLEGTVLIDISGVARTLKAGDAFLIPKGAIHNATNTGTTPAAILATYIVEKNKPLATAVQ